MALTLWHTLLPYAIKHPVSGPVKPSFEFLTSGHSDAKPWASECPEVKNYKWRFNPVWQRMLYSCTHMATVGIKGLTILDIIQAPVVAHKLHTYLSVTSYSYRVILIPRVLQAHCCFKVQLISTTVKQPISYYHQLITISMCSNFPHTPHPSAIPFSCVQ